MFYLLQICTLFRINHIGILVLLPPVLIAILEVVYLRLVQQHSNFSGTLHWFSIKIQERLPFANFFNLSWENNALNHFLASSNLLSFGVAAISMSSFEHPVAISYTQTEHYSLKNNVDKKRSGTNTRSLQHIGGSSRNKSWTTRKTRKCQKRKDCECIRNK